MKSEKLAYSKFCRKCSNFFYNVCFLKFFDIPKYLAKDLKSRVLEYFELSIWNYIEIGGLVLFYIGIILRFIPIEYNSDDLDIYQASR